MAYPAVRVDAPDGKSHRRLLAEAINRVQQGKQNVTLKVTLTPSASSTTVTDARISIDTAAIPMPTTSDAAAEIGNGTMYMTCSANTLTITHANNTQADRTFVFVLLG